MKKIFKVTATIAILAVGVLGLAACGETMDALAISAEQAQQIALANLNVSSDAVVFARSEREIENGAVCYEVEFSADGVKYEYKVNATSGEIVKLKINDQNVDAATAPIATVNPNNTYIGIEQAKTNALADAGVTAADAVFTEAESDFDDGKYLYEVDFTVGGKEYEYEIDAASGAVHKKEVEHIVAVIPVPESPSTVYKTAEEVKAIVYADLAAAADAIVWNKVEFERDNGVHVYEIELIFNAKEYDYEINATTGAIIEKKIDQENSLVPAPTVGEYIGVENAKAIAFAHAGINASAATEYEGGLEVSGGIYVYEIEFKSAGYEYEYEINAVTGEVERVDRERD